MIRKSKPKPKPKPKPKAAFVKQNIKGRSRDHPHYGPGGDSSFKLMVSGVFFSRARTWCDTSSLIPLRYRIVYQEHLRIIPLNFCVMVGFEKAPASMCSAGCSLLDEVRRKIPLPELPTIRSAPVRGCIAYGRTVCGLRRTGVCRYLVAGINFGY